MKYSTRVKFIIYLLFVDIVYPAYSQAIYLKEQLTLTNMLCDRDSMNLQKAVCAVENTFYYGCLNEQVFNKSINYVFAAMRDD